MAAWWCFLIVAIVGGTANLVIWQYDVPAVIDAINTNVFGRTTAEYLAVGLWGGVGGIGYGVSHIAFWFFLGRLVSNYANLTIQRKISTRAGKLLQIILRGFGWLVSLLFLVPFIGSLITQDFSWGFWIAGGIQFLALVCCGGIIYHVCNGPDKAYLDPHAYRQDYTPLSSHVRVQLWGFSTLVVGTIGITVLNAMIWFPSVQIYRLSTPWFEWGFYLWLGLLMTGGPLLALFFLNSVYVRRALMVYFGIVFVLVGQLALRISPWDFDFNYLILSYIFNLRVGRTRCFAYFSTAENPWQILSVFLVCVLSLLCFFIIRNPGLPIPIASREWSKFPLWQNLKGKILALWQTPIQNSRSSQEKVIRELIGVCFVVILLTGLNSTLFYEDHVIVLERPANHEMRVSFWASGFSLPNETLQELGSYHIRLFEWANAYDRDGAQRYAAFGVDLVRVIRFPKDSTLWNDVFDTARENMDYWDAHGLHQRPWQGFVLLIS